MSLNLTLLLQAPTLSKIFFQFFKIFIYVSYKLYINDIFLTEKAMHPPSNPNYTDLPEIRDLPGVVGESCPPPTISKSSALTKNF